MAGQSLEIGIGQFLRQMGAMPFLTKSGLKDPLVKMWRILCNPRYLAHAAELKTDYEEFKMRYASFLHKGQDLADPNKKLLVLSFSDYVAQVKAEAMLAKTLQLHGCTPIIVTYRSCRRALRYYRLFGINDFIFFDELTDGRVWAKAAEDASVFFKQEHTFRSIKNYEYRGVNVGRHVLSFIARSLFKGTVDLSNPSVISFLERFIPRAMSNVIVAEELIERLQPEVILTHHPHAIGEGEIDEVGLNRAIDVIFWDGAQKGDHWIFKRYTRDTKGLQPFSLSDETWEKARQMTWTEHHEAELQREIRGRYESRSNLDNRRLQEGKRLKGKEEIQKQLDLDPHKKTAVVFSHITWDESFFHGEDLFDGYEEWLVETVKAACKNQAVNWVIKLHPYNAKKLSANDVRSEPSEAIAIRNAVESLPSHVKLLYSDTDINTFSIFDLTDYCLTVRGTIGIEMACFGIPVLTAGTGRYSGRGFTVDSRSREDYFDKLRHIQDIPRMASTGINLAKKHAYCLFIQRPVNIEILHKTMRSPFEPGHPLTSNYVIRASRLEDLVSSCTLNAFAEWVLKSDRLDFLISS